MREYAPIRVAGRDIALPPRCQFEPEIIDHFMTADLSESFPAEFASSEPDAQAINKNK